MKTNPTMKMVFMGLLMRRREEHPNVRVSTHERYYKGSGNVAQLLNIEARKHFQNRDEKIQFFREMTNRDIESTKDLTVPEAYTLLGILKNQD